MDVAPEVGQGGDALQTACPIGAGQTGDVVVGVGPRVGSVRGLAVHEDRVERCLAGGKHIGYIDLD